MTGSKIWTTDQSASITDCAECTWLGNWLGTIKPQLLKHLYTPQENDHRTADWVKILNNWCRLHSPLHGGTCSHYKLHYLYNNPVSRTNPFWMSKQILPLTQGIQRGKVGFGSVCLQLFIWETEDAMYYSSRPNLKTAHFNQQITRKWPLGKDRSTITGRQKDQRINGAAIQRWCSQTDIQSTHNDALDDVTHTQQT